MNYRCLLFIVLFAQPSPALADDLLSVFDEVVTLVETQFYDPHMNGLDWKKLAAEYRAQLAPDMDRESFAVKTNAMLKTLDASHTELLTRDDPRWYQLVGLFIGNSESLQGALRPYLSNGEPIYAGIGVMLEARDEGHYVSGVLDGFPASDAGLVVGDRLVSVGGQAFHPIRSFAGQAEREVQITVERKPGELLELFVTPNAINGRTMFETAMRASSRIVEDHGKRIAYIRAWSYAGLRYSRYHEILVSELLNGTLKDADGLVLDLRGGWGGADPTYLNIFVEKNIEALSISRNGDTMKFSSGWAKPVVLLVDDQSKSGKELYAYGFRSLKKGPIVGEQTAGAVLAGRINPLSDGSVLYVAVADVKIGLERLEGVGVKPDVKVPFDPPYAAGADPQLDKAVEVAAGLTKEE